MKKPEHEWARGHDRWCITLGMTIAMTLLFWGKMHTGYVISLLLVAVMPWYVVKVEKPFQGWARIGQYILWVVLGTICGLVMHRMVSGG